jgi:transposase-like protein
MTGDMKEVPMINERVAKTTRCPACGREVDVRRGSSLLGGEVEYISCSCGSVHSRRDGSEWLPIIASKKVRKMLR